MKFNRDDGKVTFEILAKNEERGYLVKATWPLQEYPNILWRNEQYMLEKCAKSADLLRTYR